MHQAQKYPITPEIKNFLLGNLILWIEWSLLITVHRVFETFQLFILPLILNYCILVHLDLKGVQ